MGRAIRNEKHDWRLNIAEMMRGTKNNCSASGMAIQQAIVNRHMRALATSPTPPFRGLLLFHSTGSGKTAAAAMTIDAFYRTGKSGNRKDERRIIVVSSADNKDRFGEYVDDVLKTSYRFGQRPLFAMNRTLSSISSSISTDGSRLVLTTISSKTNKDTHVAVVDAVSSGKESPSKLVPAPYEIKVGSALPLLRVGAPCAWKDDKGEWWLFDNTDVESSKWEVKKWLSEAGSSPGVVSKNASGRKEKESSAFFTFTTLMNAIDDQIIDLNKCVLIIDECHGLITPTGQHAEHARRLFDELDSDKHADCVLLLMSATPGHDLEALTKTVRLLHRRDSPYAKSEPADFSPLSPAALVKFKQFCYGTLSYIDAYNDKSRFPTFVFEDPKTYSPFVVEVPMSKSHGAEYGTWLQKDKKNVKWRDEMYDPSKKMNWLSNIRSWNNVPSPHLAPGTGTKPDGKYTTQEELREYSSKLYALWSRLSADKDVVAPRAIHPKDRHYVYIPLKTSMGGMREVVAMLLHMCLPGSKTPLFKQWTHTPTTTLDAKTGQRWFFVYTGGTEDKVKMTQALAAFNGLQEGGGTTGPPDGCVLLSDKEFNKGFTLLAVSWVHLFGPPTSKADFDQIIGRPNRYCSHNTLPFPEGWKVYIVVYLSIPPESATPLRINLARRSAAAKSLRIVAAQDEDATADTSEEEESPDRFVLDHMLKQKNNSELQSYVQAMRAASIDCRLLADFHGNKEGECMSPENTAQPPWMSGWTTSMKQEVKQLLADVKLEAHLTISPTVRGSNVVVGYLDKTFEQSRRVADGTQHAASTLKNVLSDTLQRAAANARSMITLR